MSQITFLAPDASMMEAASQLFAEQYPEINIACGLLSEGVKLAAQLAKSGTDIIITRGGTADGIREAGLPVTVVEVPVTALDVINTIVKAKKYGSRIGTVSFNIMLPGVSALRDLLGVDLRLYPMVDEHQADTLVRQAFADGADAVVGGYITVQAAQKLGKPGVLIDSSLDSLRYAADEARRIAHAQDLERSKASLVRAIIDYAHDGIIAIDQDRRVTVFNPAAAKLSGLVPSAVIGKPPSHRLTALGLEKMLTAPADELGQITNANGLDILCNKVRLKAGGKTVGAVATFQDVTHIQRMEARVRKTIYAGGHVATARFDTIVANSEAMQKCIETAQAYAKTDSSVLILGETGSGKEVFAQSIHNYSRRYSGPFVAINCAALPGQILESELFGYAGGAFTGASAKGKPGLFETAHGGTLFLDEIAEMDPSLQGKLLRALQEKKIMRLGSDKVVHVDVRVIAATNQNLKTMVRENRFRSDLYYRLNVLKLAIPPLRERPADIGPLAELFLSEAAPDQPPQLTTAALEELGRYSWPGNVRELKSIAERLAAVHDGTKIDARLVQSVLDDDEPAATALPFAPKDVFERANIIAALQAEHYNYEAAAKRLGISRATLWRKRRQLGLE